MLQFDRNFDINYHMTQRFTVEILMIETTSVKKIK